MNRRRRVMVTWGMGKRGRRGQWSSRQLDRADNSIVSSPPERGDGTREAVCRPSHTYACHHSVAKKRPRQFRRGPRESERRGFFEARTIGIRPAPSLPSSPHWGMTSSSLLGPHAELVGSKSRSLRPLSFGNRPECTGHSHTGQTLRFMDLGIVAAIVMLGVWAFATFTTEAPGWIHLLLTAGVFLLIYRIVVRATPQTKSPTSPSKKNDHGVR